MEIATEWLENNGLERTKEQTYLAALFQSLAERAQRPSIESFSALSREFATKGGLNEQVLADFETKDGKAALTQALDRVLARIEGVKTSRDVANDRDDGANRTFTVGQTRFFALKGSELLTPSLQFSSDTHIRRYRSTPILISPFGASVSE